MSSRRSFVRLIAFGGAATILAACASPAPTATPAPPPKAAAPPEPTKPAAAAEPTKPAAAAPAPAAAASPTAPPAPAAAPAKPKEKVTLRLWHWDTFLVEPYEKMGAEFNRKFPHATVVVEQTP